jgi:hypothetical protein
MGYIKLTDGSAFSDPSYTFRCFSFDQVPALVDAKDIQYHGTAYGLGPVNSIEYVYSTARENWSGVPGVIQTTLSGSAFPTYPNPARPTAPTKDDIPPVSPDGYIQDELVGSTQNQIVNLTGARSPITLNADNYFNPGINYAVGTAGTTNLESTYSDNIYSGFMETNATDFYIEMPILSWPGTAIAGTVNSITFSSSPTYDSAQTVTIPFTSPAVVNSLSSAGSVTLKINRSVLTNQTISSGSVDLTNVKRVKITLGPSLGTAGYDFKTGQMKVVPSTYSHYKTNVDTKMGILKMEKWPNISQSDFPAIIQDGYTVKDFKNVTKIVVDTNKFDPDDSGLYFSDEMGIIGSPLPETTDPHRLSIFSRVHPDRIAQPNLYLETRLSIDREKVKIELYEGSTLISTTTEVGIIPSGIYYLITTYDANKQNVQIYQGKDNFIESLYFETGECSIQNSWLNGTGVDVGGYTAGYGYSGYQFNPTYGNVYLDYIYSQNVILSEYESKSFESSLPVDAATLFPNGNSDTELLSLGQDGFEKVTSSDNFRKGRNEVGSLETDVVVSNDSTVIYQNQNTSSIKVTKTENAYISSIQYSEVLRVPNFSNLTFRAKLKYENTLESGNFKIVFWDSARKRIAFIQEIQNVTPNQWNVLEIPLIADALYNDRLILEIGHFGDVSQQGSFWLQDISLTTESVEWSLSNNDGLQYLPVLTAVSDQYKSVNFPNNHFYSTLMNDDPRLVYTFNNAYDTDRIFGGSVPFTSLTNETVYSAGSVLAYPVSSAHPYFIYPVTMPATINTFTSGETYDIPRSVKSLGKDNFFGLYGSGTLQFGAVSGFSTNDITYSVWFYADYDQYNHPIGQHSSLSDWNFKLIGTNAGSYPKISFNDSSGGSVSVAVPSTNGTATWADNNWHQIGFTYDNSYLKIFYDGEIISTTPSSSFTMPDRVSTGMMGPFYIGGPNYTATLPQNPTYSKGVYTLDTSVPFTWISAIAIYNKALNTNQINEQYLAAISEYNKLRVRARAYTKDAWISGYELVPKYSHLGRLLEKQDTIYNQIIFDQSRFAYAKF